MSETPMFESMAKAGRPMLDVDSPKRPKTGGPPLISLALDQTRAAVENLRDEVYQIVEKVQPVMGPDMTAEPARAGGDRAAEPVSNVTDLINGLGADIAVLARTLRSARTRIEL